MSRGKKIILISLLAAIVLAGNITAIACAPAKNESTTVPSASQTQPSLPGNRMAEVAAILGISQQKLEDAFAQAQSELGIKEPPPPPGSEGQPPPIGNQPPGDGTVPPPPPGGSEGQPPADETVAPPAPPKELLARVAEILGIDQQKLEDAFAQVGRKP